MCIFFSVFNCPFKFNIFFGDICSSHKHSLNFQNTDNGITIKKFVVSNRCKIPKPISVESIRCYHGLKSVWWLYLVLISGGKTHRYNIDVNRLMHWLFTMNVSMKYKHVLSIYILMQLTCFFLKNPRSFGDNIESQTSLEFSTVTNDRNAAVSFLPSHRTKWIVIYIHIIIVLFFSRAVWKTRVNCLQISVGQ